ncbi:MAG: PAS domain S-box protein [Nitrospirae bacterium]|nr:PAS domain S-box protein [Nitrospirota bacterium]MDA1302703.1 PAS domain S-box protein [Nitrospirota bacterium]
MHIRRQTPVLTGYAKMESIPEVPGFHWGILVRRDKDNLLADMQDTEIKLGLVGVAMTFPLVGLLWLIVRRLENSQNIATQALAVAEINETQLVRMAQKNQDLAMRTALILDSAGEGIYGLDLNGITTFVNPAGAQMLGYAPEELVGMPMHATVHHTKADGTSYSREDCPMYAAFKEGTVHHVDNEVLWRKDGTSFSVEYTSTPQRNFSGEVIGAVVTYRDVTERKKIEAKLIDAMILTRGIVDTAADAIITIDEDGKIESYNKAARSLFGYSDGEILGQNISRLMPSPYREEHDGYLARYQQTGEKKFIGTGREVIAQQKDGSTFPVDLSVSEVQMGTRRVFTGIIRDITDRKQAERELVEARDQAYEAVRIKSEFLATMSHEIRTPMNGVLGMTGIFLDSDLNQDQRDCALTVKHSADALLTIINDILDFSKIESGKLDIEIIDFDLRVAIEDVLDLIAPKAQEKGLELVGLVYASVPTAVRGDPGRFRQILLNLVGNAIKFTERGEVVIQVVPESETPEEVFVRIDVMDTGIGISAEAQQRLFQPFSQADGSTTRKYGGTGLGLVICKQLAELMGGTVGVESDVGHGSQFWFTVRLAKQARQRERYDLLANSLAGLRICVVDDNDTNRLLLYHYTTDWGMSCLSAESGSAALALLRDAATRGHPCDLLLLDMQMPEMNGVELARLVKADPGLGGVKMIMVTSLGRRGDATVAREAGVSAYLTKPIQQGQLRECLGLVMDPAAISETPFVTKYTIRENREHIDARILVADDNIVNQKVAVRMVEKLGYRADVVANGIEAVEAVSRLAYDAILMDCQMPEMDGYEATREIRRREALSVKREEANREDSEASSQGRDPLHEIRDTRYERRLPIIAMTANAMQGDREKCLEAGMDDFVSKPVKKDMLEAALARWIPNKDGEALSVKHEAPPERQNPNEELGATSDERQHSSNALPALSEEPHLPPLDSATIESLRELAGDDLSFLVGIIQQFLQDGPRQISAIRQALERADADALMKAAHGFKGCCRNMGALPLGELCFILEQHGHAGEAANVGALLQDVDKEYCRVQAALRGELKNLAAFSS